MSALLNPSVSWWEFAGCVLAGCGLAAAVLAVVAPLVPSGDRAEAEAVQDAPDPVDEQFATVSAVLQPDLDITFADQVEAWLHRRTPTIRIATPDKEN